jgi:hypothetical protein
MWLEGVVVIDPNLPCGRMIDREPDFRDAP